jgi:hypothetical protein
MNARLREPGTLNPVAVEAELAEDRRAGAAQVVHGEGFQREHGLLDALGDDLGVPSDRQFP